jgi:pSer/pThr/pTyr-binding forkhead associated (FHA) protein
MRKLTLQFEGRMLREYVVDHGATIGRLPDNSIVIDNPAVSGHHARVVCDADAIVLEDLNSTNGTFVDGRPVTRHVLRHGDCVLVGKHTLLFEQPAGTAALPVLPALGDTVYLDTEQHRALVARLQGREKNVHEDAPRIGMLRVLGGSSERAEYDLEGHTSLIGKSDNAVVRLRGWFKPSVAVAIARNGEEYTATLLGGRTFLNGQPLKGARRLKEGDVLHVSGLELEFSLRSGREWMSARARAATGRELT